MSTPRCALGRAIPDEMDTDAVKRQGWHEQGILVVARDDPRLGWLEKQVIETIGEKLYGDSRRG